MTRESKPKEPYSQKQKLHEKHIENQYEKKGVTEKEAKKIAKTVINRQQNQDILDNFKK